MYKPGGMVVSRISEEGEQVVVEAVAAASTGICPACGQESARVHSRYARALADLPACGRPVRVCLAVRRFRCANSACERRTFAEQVPGVTRTTGTCCSDWRQRWRPSAWRWAARRGRAWSGASA